MSVSVQSQPNGLWSVVVDGEVRFSDLSNAQAWRKQDELSGEYVNAKEKRQEWAFRQIATGKITIPRKKKNRRRKK